MAWAVRPAVRLGVSSVTVCSDSEVALAQVLSLRACSHLQHQQAILHSLATVLWASGLVVRLVWVPSDLQPGNPMSRVNSEHAGWQPGPRCTLGRSRSVCSATWMPVRCAVFSVCVTADLGQGGGGAGCHGVPRECCSIGFPWPT